MTQATTLSLALSVMLSFATACGDSTGDGDDGSGNSGNSGTGNSGTGNSGNSGTGNSGNSSGSVDNCADLCDLAPVSTTVGNCVAEFITLQGYNTTDPACSDPNTPSGCLGCYDAISVTDGDCAEAHDLCF
jgi:hypothetical protein